RGSEGRDNGRACEDEWFHGVSPEKGTAIRGECGSPSARSKHLLPGAHSRRVRRVARGVAVLVLLVALQLGLVAGEERLVVAQAAVDDAALRAHREIAIALVRDVEV